MTHRQLLLQAVVEVLCLVGLELLQRDARLSYELIVAELVLVTHRNSGGEGEERKECGRSWCFYAVKNRGCRVCCAL